MSGLGLIMNIISIILFNSNVINEQSVYQRVGCCITVFRMKAILLQFIDHNVIYSD